MSAFNYNLERYYSLCLIKLSELMLRLVMTNIIFVMTNIIFINKDIVLEKNNPFNKIYITYKLNFLFITIF